MSAWRPLIIENLTAPKPVIQGGMGIDINLSSLTGAVAVERGVGIMSTAQIRFQEPDSKKDPLEANLRAVRKEFQEAKEIAPKGVTGLNVMVTTKGCTLYAKGTVKAGADIIISGAGLPITLPELVQGAKTKIAPIVSPAKSTIIIPKMWGKRYRVVPDLMVIEGPPADGHLGFSVEQPKEIGVSSENQEETYRQADYDEEARGILEIIKEYVEKYRKKIPVATTEGVYNYRDVLHQIELGVDGVQVATRLMTTEGCDASEAYKQVYIHVRQEDVVITKSPVGMPGRAIKNPFLNLVSKERQPIEHCYQCLEKCSHKTIPCYVTRALMNAAEGDTGRVLVFYGSDTYRAEKIETAADVLNGLLGDAH